MKNILKLCLLLIAVGWTSVGFGQSSYSGKKITYINPSNIVSADAFNTYGSELITGGSLNRSIEMHFSDTIFNNSNLFTDLKLLINVANLSESQVLIDYSTAFIDLQYYVNEIYRGTGQQSRAVHGLYLGYPLVSGNQNNVNLYNFQDLRTDILSRKCMDLIIEPLSSNDLTNTYNSFSLKVTSNTNENNISSSTTQPIDCINGSFSPPKIIGKSPQMLNDGYSYFWEMSTNQTNWIYINFSNTPDYQPNPINQLTYYRRSISNGYGVISRSNIISFSVKNYNNIENVTNQITANTNLKAYQQINMSKNISNNVNVKLRAGNEINFNVGFDFTPNNSGELLAVIGQPCESNYNWRIDNSIKNNFDNDPSSLHPYPNPISEGILNFGNVAESYTLYNSQGVLISQGQNTDGVNVDNLETGIYLVKVDGVMSKISVE